MPVTISKDRFEEKLEARGFEVLGVGYYASVWGKDGCDDVFKVSRDPSDGWIDYAELLLKDQFKWWANPHAPTIVSLRFYGDQAAGPGWFYVARMKRLAREVGYDTGGIQEKLYSHLKYGKEYPAHHPAMNKDMAELVALLKANFDGDNFDLHSRNMMLDFKGRQVITDPVSGSTGTASLNRGPRQGRSSSRTRAPLAA